MAGSRLLDRASVLHSATQLEDYASGKIDPTIITTGKGIRIQDMQGRSLIDEFSGLYCVNIGYGRTEVAEAIAQQAYWLADYHTFAAHTVGAHFQMRLKERFAQLEIVGEVKGVGLLGTVEFVADRNAKRRFDPLLKVGPRISKAARDRGLIARAMPHGNILGFAPLLIVSESEIDEMVEIAYKATRQAMDELAK